MWLFIRKTIGVCRLGNNTYTYTNSDTHLKIEEHGHSWHATQFLWNSTKRLRLVQTAATQHNYITKNKIMTNHNNDPDNNFCCLKKSINKNIPQFAQHLCTGIMFVSLIQCYFDGMTSDKNNNETKLIWTNIICI